MRFYTEPRVLAEAKATEDYTVNLFATYKLHLSSYSEYYKIQQGMFVIS